ncbi:MAG: hypothetical protein A2096_01255 [Spirochaetes bacterium GWF1_41_5]|nr:MAG: hypothetical protein A2096_01255 [Spirochaetes bacterium GWF1_41_5]HBE02200.1 AbrB/MazE/SpoVT family DNA-binding domain-containing protein [Spirochaetia bacterium]
MNTAKLFINGQSQAVRLPKKYRFKCNEVYINKIDDAVILYPKKSAWRLFQQSLDKFSDDFLNERNQPICNDKRDNI